MQRWLGCVVCARISPADSIQHLTASGIDVYLGQARFVSRDAVEVDDRRLTFAKAEIAHVGDLLTYFTPLMSMGKGLLALASPIYPYSTQSEAIKRLANAYRQMKLTPWVKKLLSQLLAWTR